SPTLQRFLSEDPLDTASGGSNNYAYVSNSPTNLIDPSGLCGLSISGLLHSAIGRCGAAQALFFWISFVPGGAELRLAEEAAVELRTLDLAAEDVGGGVLRHYTTADAAKAISEGGRIEPRAASGKIWLTPDEYASGAEARSAL